MEKEDKRLKRDGFEKAQKVYLSCMKVLDNYLLEKKELRTGLMNFYPNSWLEKNMIAVTSQNFKLKNLKQFFCYEVLQLSQRPEVTISEYDRYFDLECKKQRVHVDLDTIVEFSDNPELLMKRLRELTYEKYLKYLDASDITLVEDEEKQVNKKKQLYLEFAKALLLYDIFVKQGLLWILLAMDKVSDIMDELDEEGDWDLEMEGLGFVPSGAIPLVEAIREWCAKENRHVISLYAMRALVQMTEYLSSTERCLDSDVLMKMAIPEFASDKFRLTEYIWNSDLAEKLIVHTEEGLRDKLRQEYIKYFSYYQETTLAEILFTDTEERRKFQKEVEKYIQWMRDREWEKAEDANITDIEHPELNVASVSFTDENIDLLPSGQSVWSMFFANLKREEQ